MQENNCEGLGAPLPFCVTRGDRMNVIWFEELGEQPRVTMAGKRWLLLNADDLPRATKALMFSELEDVLVAVDHRGANPDWGLWSRAVHVLVVDGGLDEQALRLESGVSKVISDDNIDLLDCLW